MKLREEELNAKYLMEHVVFPGRTFVLSDKPDLQEAAGTIGVEHRLVTTQDAMRMEKSLEEFLEQPEEAGGANGLSASEIKFGALMIENGILGARSAKKKEMLDMMAAGLLEKLERLNSGGYRNFPRNELFLTMREYPADSETVESFAVGAWRKSKKFALHFERIYIYALQMLYILENGRVQQMLPLDGELLLAMEEETARVMGVSGKK